MEREAQGRFIPDTSSNEFQITRPLPTDCEIRMYGKREVYVVKREVSRELIRQAHKDKMASQDEFYAAHPEELHGENAYFSWLAQASDY